jgi:2'-phosphotransferase
MVQVSKALSLILRHKAEDFGLAIRPDGFCVLSDVLNLPMLKRLQATQVVVEQITRTNDKKRFEMSVIDGHHMIRAVQGHSLKSVVDEELLQQLHLSDTLPEKCVHGTYFRHWESILSKGLLVGGLGAKGHRNHIHFAPYDVSDKRVISGMRTNCDMAIYIDLRKAMTAGVSFYKAKNEVILTQGEGGALLPKYFLSAVNIKTGEVLFPVSN